MKKLVYFSVAVFAISLLACQDGKDDAKNITDLSFYRNIGKQIPTETGYRWMDVYRTKNNLSARTKPLGFALSKENLAKLSSSVDELIGVAFQHAYDDAGEHHFLIIPVDASLAIWAANKTIIDANSDTEISDDVARHWADNYERGNPDQIWFHFFGKHVFDEMAAIPFFEYIQIEPAISDVNYTPQVLLIINDLTSDSSTGGRGEMVEAVVYDASSGCPPCPLVEN
ncbi:MAG TPA: hypothetical protein VGD40_13385 [Chryseosolibacter sp.]